jgi:two-component system chemotaxis sensor kinase CheA
LAPLTSLRTKLVRTMVATLLWVGFATLLIVAALNYSSSRSTLANIEGHLRANIEQKGRALADNQALALRDLVMDNAFGDVSRLVERTVTEDPRMLYGLFLGGDQRPWGFAVRHGGVVGATQDFRQLIGPSQAPLVSGVQITPKRVFGETVYEFAVPVVDDKGGYLGSLRYGLSDQPLREALAEARAESRKALATTVGLLLLLGAGTMALGFLRSRKAATFITRPLGVLTEAVNAFARGERRTRVVIESKDELELLGDAFNHMASELQDYYARLEQLNRTLEARVEDRTRALSERNRDMLLVLDNVDQGLLTISVAGQLAPERSAVVEQWFGAPDDDSNILSYLGRIDRKFCTRFRLGLEALQQDFMPLAVILDQLPLRLRHHEREYQCSYCPIQVADRVEGLLMVIKDITAELISARKQADGQERLALFNQVVKDRVGLLAFVAESSARLLQLPNATPAEQRRSLHTLKGNAGQMGLALLASMCHELEDQMARTEGALPAGAFESLQHRWTELNQQLHTLLEEKPADVLELSRAELESVLAELDADVPRSSLRAHLSALALEPAERQLLLLGQYAQALAQKLGRAELKLEVDGGGVRLDGRSWTSLWAEMVHVVRNAVDHGIETEAARVLAGKPLNALLKLSTRLEGRSLRVEIQDDGAGIAWEQVRAAAIARDLPHATEAQLVSALFSDGLSTRAQVSETSGRGIGLGAVRRQVELRQGSISVTSQPGAGTCFAFSLPLAPADRAAVLVSASPEPPSGCRASLG